MLASKQGSNASCAGTRVVRTRVLSIRTHVYLRSLVAGSENEKWRQPQFKIQTTINVVVPPKLLYFV